MSTWYMNIFLNAHVIIMISSYTVCGYMYCDVIATVQQYTYVQYVHCTCMYCDIIVYSYI